MIDEERYCDRPVQSGTSLGRPSALLLDSFGTLVRMEPPAPRLVRTLAREGITVSEERAAHAFKQEIAFYLAHHVEGSDGRALSNLRDRCASVLSEALDEPSLRLPEARRAMLAAIRFDPYPDAAPALRALRARGLRLVVASNWDCSLAEVIARAGLAPLLDGVVSSAEVGAAKPDSRLFEAALRQAGCAPGDAVHVGDSRDSDVGGAQAAGIGAIWLRRDGARRAEGARDASAGPPAVVEIERLTDLVSLI